MTSQINPFADEAFQQQQVPTIPHIHNSINQPENTVPQVFDQNQLVGLMLNLQKQLDTNQQQKQPKQKQPTHDQILNEIISGFSFFKDENSVLHIKIPIENENKIISIKDDMICGAINYHFRKRTGKLLKKYEIISLLEELQVEKANSAVQLPYLKRIAKTEDSIYIDMKASPDEFLKIDLKSGEKSILKEVPFIVKRHDTHLPLPLPVLSNGKALSVFYDLLTIKDEGFRCLLTTFGVCKILNINPLPFLFFVGMAGSGKTTSCHLFGNIFDPVKYVSQIQAKKFDMALHFHSHFIPLLDNVSSLSRDIADAICGFYTGHNMNKKVEFTVSSKFSFDTQNAGIFTMLNIKNPYQDMMSRVFIIPFEKSNDLTKDIDFMEDEFKQLHPYILNEFIEIAVKVNEYLHLYKKLPIADRSKQFCRVGTCISEIVYGDKEMFKHVIDRNNHLRYGERFNENEAIYLLRKYMADKSEFNGTYSKMIMEIMNEGYDIPLNLQNASSFARKIQSNVEFLNELGIDIFNIPNHASQYNMKIINRYYSDSAADVTTFVNNTEDANSAVMNNSEPEFNISSNI